MYPKILYIFATIMKSEDRELVLSVIQGNKKAFDYFYNKEYKKTLFYAMQYLHNKDIAQDIVQDSFVSLWEKREFLDSNYPLQPYLYSIIRNNCINNLKRLSVDKRIMSDITKREYTVYLNALKDESAESLINFQLEEFISKAYLELPDKISSAFIDSRLRGMTYKEIAEKRGISVKTVEYHITQALKHFKIKLKEFIE